MKKILFLASALFMSWAAFATPLKDFNGNTLVSEFDWFDSNFYTEIKDGTTDMFQYFGPWSSGGWDLSGKDGTGTDFIGQGMESVTVVFEAPLYPGQITLNVGYVDAEGNPVTFNSSDANFQVAVDGFKSSLTVVFKQGYNVEYISVGNGWFDNIPTAIDYNNWFIENTGTSAEVKVVSATINETLIYPEYVFSNINLNEFDAGFVFLPGYNYYPMSVDGWDPTRSINATIVNKDGGNALKIELDNSVMPSYDKLVIFQDVRELRGFGDFASITFDVFWESAQDEDGTLTEGEDVYKELILYFGDKNFKLGGGNGINKGVSYKAMPSDENGENAKVGIIGEWFTFKIYFGDILASDGTKEGIDALLKMREFAFGIGFNDNGAVYYLRNISLNSSICKCGTEIIARPNNSLYGSVIRLSSSDFAGRVEARLKAVPNEGYEFVNWTSDGKVVSKNAEASFSVYQSFSDLVLTANFKRITNNNETTESKKTTIFPTVLNSGNILHISGISDRANVIITDLSGKILKNEIEENTQGKVSVLIDYPSGVYIMKIATDEEIKTTKIVVK